MVDGRSLSRPRRPQELEAKTVTFDISRLPDGASCDAFDEAEETIPEAVASDLAKLAEPSGIRFGAYALLGAAGEGGMARIHVARTVEPPPRDICVIKRLHRGLLDNEEHRAMFIEEAKIGARLAHPNIVEQYDAGAIDGVPYIALEYVDGLSLLTLLNLAEEDPVPPSAALEIGLSVSRGLQYMHDLCDDEGRSLELIHRDISPDNILVARDGSVKIADLGLARFRDRSVQTRHGFLKGKLAYMAPEQLLFQPLDGRIDIYALGVVLTELLTLEPLVPEGLDAVAEIPERIRTRCEAEGLDEDLIELLLWTTALRHDDRLPEVGLLAEALEEAIADIERPVSLGQYLARSLLGRLPCPQDPDFAEALADAQPSTAIDPEDRGKTAGARSAYPTEAFLLPGEEETEAERGTPFCSAAFVEEVTVPSLIPGLGRVQSPTPIQPPAAGPRPRARPSPSNRSWPLVVATVVAGGMLVGTLVWLVLSR